MSEKPRILLVDDELSMIKIVERRLGVEGYAVLTAMDGQEAMTKAQSEHPDLIILDLKLPLMDGDEVCRRLKQDPRCHEIPVILFTAKAQETDGQIARACGAEAYVRKPFHVQELLERVRTLLAGSATDREVGG